MSIYCTVLSQTKLKLIYNRSGPDISGCPASDRLVRRVTRILLTILPGRVRHPDLDQDFFLLEVNRHRVDITRVRQPLQRTSNS